MINPGIKVIVNDPSDGELQFQCSNGIFSGAARVYSDPSELLELAAQLRGFPKRSNDSFNFEAGTFEPQYVGGGIKLQFESDKVGHVSCFVTLRSQPFGGPKVFESVSLILSLEPSAIDTFVTSIEQLDWKSGQWVSIPAGG